LVLEVASPVERLMAQLAPFRLPGLPTGADLVAKTSAPSPYRVRDVYRAAAALICLGRQIHRIPT